MCHHTTLNCIGWFWKEPTRVDTYIPTLVRVSSKCERHEILACIDFGNLLFQLSMSLMTGLSCNDITVISDFSSHRPDVVCWIYHVHGRFRAGFRFPPASTSFKKVECKSWLRKPNQPNPGILENNGTWGHEGIWWKMRIIWWNSMHFFQIFISHAFWQYEVYNVYISILKYQPSINTSAPECVGARLSPWIEPERWAFRGLGNAGNTSTMEPRNRVSKSQVVIFVFWIDCDETSEKIKGTICWCANCLKSSVFPPKDLKPLIRLIETFNRAVWHKRMLCAETRKSQWPVHA